MDKLLLDVVLIIISIIVTVWAWKKPTAVWTWKKTSDVRRGALLIFPTKKTRKDELYERLLCQVFGDRQKAQRLIDYAQYKNPGLSNEQCIEMASRSLETDITRWD